MFLKINNVAMVITKPKTSFLKIKNKDAYINMEIVKTFSNNIRCFFIDAALEKHKTAMYTKA